MPVSIERQGPAAVVKLGWPERRNAIGPQEATELAAAIAEAAEGTDISGVVISGEGAFCAGGDLPAILRLADQGPAAVRDSIYGDFQRIPRTILRTQVPVVAAVDGPAVGLGMDLALMCDDRFFGPQGWLRQGWAAVGLVPGTGGALMLRRLNPALLWELLGDQRRIDGETAAEMGLGHFNPQSGLDEAVKAIAKLSSIPAAALAGYVELQRGQLLAEVDAHLERCLDHQVRLLTSPGFRARAEAAMSARPSK